MDNETKDKMIEYLMKTYRDKTEDWVFGEVDEDVDLDDDRWSDFDSYSDDEEMEDDFEVVSTILMDELTANNLDSHILLKYPRIADWWGKVLTTRKKKEEKKRKAEEARRKKEEDARARESLLARLTPEERRLLGIK